jgi:hypothetical protein
MNPESPQSTADENARSPEALRRSRRWKWVERGFTLAGLFIVLVLGWSVVQGMQQLFSQNEMRPTASNTEPAVSALVAGPATSLTAGGHWQMANWQWAIGVSRLAENQIDERLRQVPEKPMIAELSSDETAAIQRLIDALQDLPLKRSTHDGFHWYQLNEGHSKICVITTACSEAESLVSIGAAIKNPGANDWALFELRSNPTRAVSSVKHVLELPLDCSTLCSRTDEQGSVLFEIVRSEMDIRELVGWLRDQGWTTKIFSHTIPTVGGSDESFLCAKQGDLVHTWSVSSDEIGYHRIALMRVSGGYHGNLDQE